MIYMAWLLVAIRLLVPLALPNPAMNELRPGWSTDAAARPVADQIRVRFQDAMSNAAYVVDPDSRHTRTDAEPTLRSSAADLLSEIASTSYYGWTGKWFLLGYAAVAAGVGGWMLLCNAGFHRKMKRQRVGELSGDLAEKYQALCAELKVRPVPVWLTDPLSSACLVGVWRPYIALPLTMKDDDALLALRHELCHYRVKDHWWTLVRCLCCVVQWFNPLVWWGAHCCRQDSELACDSRVIRTMDENQRKTYAALLLTSAARRSSPGLAVAATGMTATGRRLKQRMASILENRAVRRGTAIAFLCIGCVGLVLAFGTMETEQKLYDPNNDKLTDNEAFGTAAQLFPAGDSGKKVGMPGTIQNAADARAQAERYLAQPVLIGTGNPDWLAEQEWCVFPSVNGWEVSALIGDGYYFCLTLDESGHLLSWKSSTTLLGWTRDDAEITDDLIGSMEHLAQQYAQRYLGGGEIAEVKVTYLDDFYTVADMLLDSQPYSMTAAEVMGEKPQIRMFRQERLEGVVQTQWEALELMLDYLTEELGIPLVEADSDIHRVTWDEETGCMIGTVSAQAYWMSEEARARLAKINGPQERYTLRMVIDPNGKGIKSVEYVPPETYPDKKAIDHGTAVVNAETMEIIDGKYMTWASCVPAGTPYDILETVNCQDAGFVSTAGTSNYHSLTLIRYMHPYFQAERTQWVPTQMIELNAEREDSRHEVTCQLDGRDVTAVCVSKHILDPDFYLAQAPETSKLTEADALATALRVSQDSWWGAIPVEELTLFPVEIGHAVDAACWQVTFRDPLCANRFYRVSIDAVTGEVTDVYDPLSGNG